MQSKNPKEGSKNGVQSNPKLLLDAFRHFIKVEGA